MGGIGSGSWYRWSKKTYVDDCRCIDISRMLKTKAIVPCGWKIGNWIWKDSSGETLSTIGYEANTIDPESAYLELKYKIVDSQEAVDYKVKLSRSPASFNGFRWWFICPHTQKRVTKLYLPYGAKRFLSRHAYNLSYASQSKGFADRQISKKWKIVRKTDGDSYPVRPKGMHKKTFEKIMDEFYVQEEIADRIVFKKMALLLGNRGSLAGH
jgi:hypothetical protein